MTPYLLHLPGVRLIVAMTILAAIGDITRFPTSKKLVGYSGLAAGVHDRGQTHRTGHITKEGRKELRYVLVEAAWHVLTERATDQHADPDMVAFPGLLSRAGKLMTWSWKLTQEQRGGLTTRQFVRYQLLRLGLGHDLTHVMRGGGKYLIASHR